MSYEPNCLTKNVTRNKQNQRAADRQQQQQSYIVREAIRAGTLGA